MGGSGSGSQSTTTTIKIPQFGKIPLLNYVKAALNLSAVDEAGSFISGVTSSVGLIENPNKMFTLTDRFGPFGTPEHMKTYADQNADELDGISRVINRATSGSAVVASGEARLQDVFDGTTLATNPKQDALFDKRKERLVQEYDEETLPRIDESFNLMGRYGGGAHHVAQAKAAESLMAKISTVAQEVYEDSYFMERAVQQSSYHLGIQYGTEDVKDAEMRRHGGLYKREHLQGRKEDDAKRSRYVMDGNVKRIQILGNAIRSGIGAQVTETKPYFEPTQMQEVAGLALAGMSLAGSMYGSFKGGAGTQPSSSQTSGGANLGFRMPGDGGSLA
ncbi:MAG: hypothetical protein ABGX83_05265 [Nitrospira sp.]